MPFDEKQLIDHLTGLGIETTTHRHPPVFTVEESKRLRGELPGAHVKNLFLKSKKKALFLVVAREDKRIDLKQLKKVLGTSNLSFGKPELLQSTLGVTPGSVTAFAVVNDSARAVHVIVDRDLLSAELVNFHPLHNAATTAIEPDDLMKFFAAGEHRVTVLEFE